MKKPVLIKLVKDSKTTTDDWGNPIPNITEWGVFAVRMSVRQSEFYQAANQGLKPNIVFEIYSEEFQDAELVRYDSQDYSIIRTYQKTLDRLELICEKKVANGFSS